MKGFKGTPGPWFWQGGVLCNKDFIIGGLGHNFNNQANKNLITAAPELLEALQLIMNGDFYMPKESADVARLAIAKAIGESQ